MPETRKRSLRPNRLWLVLGITLMVVAAAGELLGWWRDFGVILGLISTILTIWYGVGAATERTVDALGEPLATIADGMKTTHAILVRIEALLDARLPRP
jgi:hypothetical protein